LSQLDTTALRGSGTARSRLARAISSRRLASGILTESRRLFFPVIESPIARALRTQANRRTGQASEGFGTRPEHLRNCSAEGVGHQFHPDCNWKRARNTGLTIGPSPFSLPPRDWNRSMGSFLRRSLSVESAAIEQRAERLGVMARDVANAHTSAASGRTPLSVTSEWFDQCCAVTTVSIGGAVLRQRQCW
jgi:hypothetical protein